MGSLTSLSRRLKVSALVCFALLQLIQGFTFLRPSLLSTQKYYLKQAPVGRHSERYLNPYLPLTESTEGPFIEEDDDDIFSVVEFTGPRQMIGDAVSCAKLAYIEAIDRFFNGKKATQDEWKQFGRLAGQEKVLLVCSIASLILAAFCEVAFPHYSAQALNAIAIHQDYPVFLKNLKSMVVFGLVGPLLTGFRGVFFWLSGIRVVTRLRLLLFSAMLDKDISYFDETETGVLTSRLSSDTKKLENVVGFHFNILMRELIQAAGGIAYLFHLHRRLAAVAVSALLLTSSATSLYSIVSRRLSRGVQDALASANSAAEQALALVRVVRSHAAEGVERRRYGARLQAAMVLEESQGLAYGAARFALGSARQLANALVLLRGASYVQAGKMTGEQLVTFMFYTKFVADSSFDVGDQWAKIQEALGGGSAVFELLRGAEGGKLDKKNGADSSSSLAEDLGMPFPQQEALISSDHFVDDSSIQLSFHNVSFQYPSRQASVLDNISFSIKKGEKCAIVGPSGGGKSTLLRLVGRLYAPDAGAVRLSGEDMRALGRRELARRLAWVTQEPELFALSVAENIAYGLPAGSYTRADVEEAARGANVHDFVASLPAGYDTVVGEGGGGLSGGQKQRVAIARALIRNPEVLLLDEPTSALDPDSEAAVQDALDRAGEGRTVVLVAHRIATVRNADRILVVRNGRLVEQGTHTGLVAAGGEYARMVAAEEARQRRRRGRGEEGRGTAGGEDVRRDDGEITPHPSNTVAESEEVAREEGAAPLR